MTTFVGDQEHVLAELEQRADQKHEVPAIYRQKVQEDGKLALHQKLGYERPDDLVHPAAASGRSRTCCAMSAAKRSSPLSALRKNNVPAAPMARSARPASRRTRHRWSRRRSASRDPACQ